MGRGLRQIKRIREKRERYLAEHPEVKFIYSVLFEIYHSREANDLPRLSKALEQVDEYIGTIVKKNVDASTPAKV